MRLDPIFIVIGLVIGGLVIGAVGAGVFALFFKIFEGWWAGHSVTPAVQEQEMRRLPDAETVAYDGRVNDALSMFNRAERERAALEVENRRLDERIRDLQAQIPTVGYRDVERPTRAAIQRKDLD